MRNPIGKLLLLAVMLTGLPLVDVWLAGKPVFLYLAFPPITSYVQHAPFSRSVFLLLFLFASVVCWPFFLRIVRRAPRGRPSVPAHRRLPWWGVAGTAISAVSWILAWNRFSWFEALQIYTFFPLWFGYIITVNSLTYCRTGQCLLKREPRFFLALFPLSALFWWFFEYLNRFAQNWHYLGIESISAAGYVIHATICFSTVLPAVLSTEEYLAACPLLREPLAGCWILRIRRPRLISWTVLILAGGGLAGIGVWPDYLFPLLWVAPFLIITAVQAINGEKTVLAPIRSGDWRPIWLPAMAALVCGFFWEMWNFKSMAHWEYSVPYVQGFYIFEMPLLGYIGYLPFGLECMVVAGLIRRSGEERKDDVS